MEEVDKEDGEVEKVMEEEDVEEEDELEEDEEEQKWVYGLTDSGGADITSVSMVTQEERRWLAAGVWLAGRAREKEREGLGRGAGSEILQERPQRSAVSGSSQLGILMSGGERGQSAGAMRGRWRWMGVHVLTHDAHVSLCCAAVSLSVLSTVRRYEVKNSL